MILQTILIICLSLYFLLIKKFHLGWNNLPSFEDNYKQKVSIIIAARNEAIQLPDLIVDLCNQSYPSDLIEIIIVDDNSEDGSTSLLSKFKNVYCLKAKGVGKKNAISQAIGVAKNDFILTTDADCRIPKDWVLKMLSPFADNEVQLSVGGVVYQKGNNSFENWQALEFMSLIGSGAGAIGAGFPFMCNGANLAFRKEFFSAFNQVISLYQNISCLHVYE